MRLWRKFTIVALSFCVLSAVDGRAQTAANASAASADQLSRFTGTYRYAGGAREDEARKAAIDHAVEGMSSFSRPIARNRITATTQIPGFYTFSFDPGKIKVLPESRPEMVSGDKGEPADYVYNGKRSTLTQALAGDRITQMFVSDDGKRENEFMLAKDGQTLTLKVTVTNSRLSNPVVYSLSYKKAD
jgi:hypothetical protein